VLARAIDHVDLLMANARVRDLFEEVLDAVQARALAWFVSALCSRSAGIGLLLQA
jgi:hypothetical protein